MIPATMFPRVALERRQSYPKSAPSIAVSEKLRQKFCAHSCSVEDCVPENGIITKQIRGFDQTSSSLLNITNAVIK